MSLTLVVCVFAGGHWRPACGPERLRVVYCDPCAPAAIAPCTPKAEDPSEQATPLAARLDVDRADVAESLTAELAPDLGGLAAVDPGYPLGYNGRAMGYGGYGGGSGLGGGWGLGGGNGQGAPGRGFGFAGGFGGGSGGGEGSGEGTSGQIQGQVINVNVSQFQAQSQSQFQFQNQNQSQHQNGGGGKTKVPTPATACFAVAGLIGVAFARRKGLLT